LANFYLSTPAFINFLLHTALCLTVNLAKHTTIAVGTSVALVVAVLAFAAVVSLVKKFKSRAQKRHVHEAMSVTVEPQSPNGHLSVCYENIPCVAARALNQSECQHQQPTSANDVEHVDSSYQQLQFQNSPERDGNVYDEIRMRNVEHRDNPYQQLQFQNCPERDSHTYDVIQMRDVEEGGNQYQQLQFQHSTERDSHAYDTTQHN